MYNNPEYVDIRVRYPNFTVERVEKRNALLAEYDKVMEQIDSLMHQAMTLKYEVGEVVGLNFTYYTIGWRACESALNPLDRCVYHVSDSANDQCYWCGLPEERK